MNAVSRRADPVFARGEDSRPRIHIWPTPTGHAWSDGPRGGRSGSHATVGRAVDAALLAIGRCAGGAVIILEARHG